MISIGAHYRGPELDGTAIDKAISLVRLAVVSARGDTYGFIPSVNVVFYVPGSLGEFEDLTKIEAARFTRKDRKILIAVPVPKEVVNSDNACAFVIDALHQANGIAADVFARKGIDSFDFRKAEEIVEGARQVAWNDRLEGE